MKKFLSVLMVLALMIVPVAALASNPANGTVTQNAEIVPSTKITDPGLISLNIAYDQPTLNFTRDGLELKVEPCTVQFVLTNNSLAGTTPVSTKPIKTYFNGTLNITATADFNFSGINVSGKLNTPSEKVFPLPNKSLGVGNIDNVTKKFSFAYDYADNGAPLANAGAVEAAKDDLKATVTFRITPVIAPRF